MLLFLCRPVLLHISLIFLCEDIYCLYTKSLIGMIHSRLEKLFESYGFSHKDRADFLNIYNLLPSHKKVRVIDNFDSIAGEIWLLRNDLVTQQEILFWKTLWNIEKRLEDMKKQHVKMTAKQEIELLKNLL